MHDLPGVHTITICQCFFLSLTQPPDRFPSPFWCHDKPFVDSRFRLKLITRFMVKVLPNELLILLSITILFDNENGDLRIVIKVKQWYFIYLCIQTFES